MYIPCLEEGILLKCFGFLGNIFSDTRVSKSENREIVVKEIIYLLDFMLIVGCE